METKIKICGMDRLEVAIFCAKNNIEYLGLHFFPEIENKKTIEERAQKVKLYKEIRKKLPNTKLVLVTRTKYPEDDIQKEIREIFELCKEVKVDYLQLNRNAGMTSDAHVKEFKDMFEKAGLNIGLIAVLDKTELVIEEVKAVAKVADFLLFEAGSHGGSGKTASDDRLLEVLPHISGTKFFYAGGLNASNVADIIHKINPFAIDVESSLESPKGKKSESLMTEFIDIVRNVSETGFNIAWRTVEDESLLSKIKFLTLLENKNRFQNTTIRLENRIENMLDSLPKEYHTAALAALSNIIYITEQMLTDAWKSLWYQYKNDFRHRDRIGLHLGSVHIFELDRDGSYAKFFKDANILSKLGPFFKLNGRLDDKLPFNSVDILLDYLERLDNNNFLFEKELLELYALTRKKHWILLVDISLSGDSVCSEIKKLQRIADYILKVQDLDISIFIQVATEEAQVRIAELLKDSNGNIDCYYAIKIPYKCAFNAKEKNKEYKLLKDKEIINKIDELCSYFAKNIILKFPTSINKQIERAREDYGDKVAGNFAKYGYGGLGWNVITYKNAPNNSLPFLWCQPIYDDCKYKAPFTREDSRVNEPDDVSKEAEKQKKEWIEEVLCIKGNTSNIARCNEIYEKYLGCFENYPTIRVRYGGNDEQD